ncbi:MAG: MarR family transcriptional regulator [Nitrosomonadales bacterium]|nr:MarR family transcriptional regulator [Nitrosomonadales bacterium]
MKQNKEILKLLDFTNNDHPFGNVQGKEIFRKLADYIDDHPSVVIFGISLAGIEATDASFPRESVISIAKQYRESRGFYLEQVQNPDILDNWNYAARAKDQPLVYWNKNKYKILGPELTSASAELVNYVLTKGSVLASQAAVDLDISVQNASTRLKKLVDQGYILRTEDVAESGGIEYVYQAIK